MNAEQSAYYEEIRVALTDECALQGVRLTEARIARLAKALLAQEVEYGDVAIMAAIVGATS